MFNEKINFHKTPKITIFISTYIFDYVGAFFFFFFCLKLVDLAFYKTIWNWGQTSIASLGQKGEGYFWTLTILMGEGEWILVIKY